ncbi:MAG: transporter substrate-binding domain-containing protein [Marmoricola sp.]
MPTSPCPRSRFLRTIGVLVAGSGLALTTACGGSSGGTANGVQLVKAKTLTVCTHLPYKPFEFTKGGKVVGFDASMLQKLADDLGVKMNVVSIGWNQITGGAAFAANQCDLGMGAATITPERKKSVQFSDPYFNATQALLVTKKSPYKGLADLKGKKLGVQTDTTGQIYANKYAKKYGYTTVVFDDSLSEFNAVKTGAVDAAINDNGPEYNFANQNSGAEVTKEFNTGEHYGFMAKKGDANATKLVNRLNTVIAKTKKDGSYQQIFKKWFGTAPKNVNG